jgi:hypothetical protein
LIYAPVALFVYNRPDHIRRTIYSLLQNKQANDTALTIFSDAPKSETQVEAVREVRKYIREIEGFKSVTIVERETNLGLARSIIDGVTSIVSKYGRIIVLEDDLEISPYFLNYMNDALDLYEKEERVMHVSGYMFPIDNSSLLETFFLRPTSCWGWATWDRAWKYFNKDLKVLLTGFTKQDIFRFNMEDTYDYWKQVEQNEAGVINTWAIFWYASVFQVGGLCLHPARSLIKNIGHDDTGEHCEQSEIFSPVLANKRVTYFEKNIIESELAHARTKVFFRSIRPGYFQRGIAYLSKKIGI